MSNSQIITHSFEFVEPATLEEALEALKADGSRLLAGGTDLLNRMKDGRETPTRVIYIGRLPELTGMSDGDPFVLGAAVPMSVVERHPVIRESFPALAEAVNSVGGLQIRNTATIAGNLGNASPGADTTPVLVAYGAELVLTSSGGERIVPVEEFFTGPGKTVLKPGELIKQVRIPKPGISSGAAFMKITRVTLDIAKINCAVYLEREGRLCKTLRIAVGSAAPRIVRAHKAEKALTGAGVTEHSLKKAWALIGDDIRPIDDIRSTGEYRREVASVLAGDVFNEAWKRSGGEIE